MPNITLRSRISWREADADIVAARPQSAGAPYREPLAVPGGIAAARRRFFDRGRAQVAEWRRRARSRRELRMFGDRDLLDIGVTRRDAETEAMKPFWRQ